MVGGKVEKYESASKNAQALSCGYSGAGCILQCINLKTKKSVVLPSGAPVLPLRTCQDSRDTAGARGTATLQVTTASRTNLASFIGLECRMAGAIQPATGTHTKDLHNCTSNIRISTRWYYRLASALDSYIRGPTPMASLGGRERSDPGTGLFHPCAPSRIAESACRWGLVHESRRAGIYYE